MAVTLDMQNAIPIQLGALVDVSWGTGENHGDSVSFVFEPDGENDYTILTNAHAIQGTLDTQLFVYDMDGNDISGQLDDTDTDANYNVVQEAYTDTFYPTQSVYFVVAPLSDGSVGDTTVLVSLASEAPIITADGGGNTGGNTGGTQTKLPMKFYISDGTDPDTIMSDSQSDAGQGNLAVVFAKAIKKIFVGDDNGYVDFLGGVNINDILTNQAFIDKVTELSAVNLSASIVGSDGSLVSNATVTQTADKTFEIAVPNELVATGYKIVLSDTGA